MPIYLVKGSVPVGAKRTEVVLSRFGMFDASRAVLLLIQAKTWAPGAAGGYSFQPAIFNSDVADAVFGADAHLTDEPTLCWGEVVGSAVVNTKVYKGANQYNQFVPIVSSADGKIWVYPAKANAAEVETHFEIVLCTDP
ncbi:hypothetical protein UFOVP1382_165 [uncultured Caudovirales phage]|uniref:Uncharacterized protein n=1 Tax=uncultured Caudovirales phage TaxID=2100421 RepID=A0A6J5S5A4_9CAUD|nr:hypothetical protein UFOVP1382_165 [uncultured Caudovirales phage]